MQKPSQIVDDERPIISIITGGEDYTILTVGKYGVTSIVAYNETGQSGYVHYYAVYKGDWLYARMNGADIERVYYGDAPTDSGAF